MQIEIDIGEKFAETVRNIEISHLLANAISYHEAGQLSEAAKAYQYILQANNTHPIALNNLSILLNDEDALKLLSKAIEIQPDYVDALVNSGVRHINLGQITIANEFASKAQKIAPSNTNLKKLIDKLELISAKVPKNLTKEPPEFTVIIPTHLRAKLLARTLESIKNQTIEIKHEIIVISDCTDEKTDQVCRQFLSSTDTYIRRSGIPGPSESRNLALKLAKGKIVLFLDDDDAWHLNFIEQLICCEPLKNGMPIYFNCSIMKEVRNANEIIPLGETFVNNKNRLNDDVFVKNQLSNSALAYPRELLSGLEFDTHMKAYEDWEFLLGVYERKIPVFADILGPIIYEVDDSTSDRRGNSKPANDINAVMDYLYTYRRHPHNEDTKIKRMNFLSATGIILPIEFFQ